MNKKPDEGIVMKVTEKKIVMLCEGGEFRNVPRQKNDLPKIGQLYQVPKPKKRFSVFSQLAAVAALFLVMAFSYTMFSSDQADAAYVVAIDINPKVEVYADKHFHVIRVKPINSDGKTIKQSLHIHDHSLFNVVQQIIQASISKGFLPKDQKGLITTTIIPLQKHLKPINHQIEDTIQKPLKDQAVNAKVYVMNGNKKLLNQSKKADLSVNQEQFYMSLKQKGFTITPDEIRSKTMKQLDSMQAIANKHKNKKNDKQKTGTTTALQTEMTNTKHQSSKKNISVPKQTSEDHHNHLSNHSNKNVDRTNTVINANSHRQNEDHHASHSNKSSSDKGVRESTGHTQQQGEDSSTKRQNVDQTQNKSNSNPSRSQQQNDGANSVQQKQNESTNGEQKQQNKQQQSDGENVDQQKQNNGDPVNQQKQTDEQNKQQSSSSENHQSEDENHSRQNDHQQDH